MRVTCRFICRDVGMHMHTHLDIFIRGGNWIATDQLLRYTADAQRYDTEVRMHAEMGLNLIRVW